MEIGEQSCSNRNNGRDSKLIPLKRSLSVVHNWWRPSWLKCLTARFIASIGHCYANAQQVYSHACTQIVKSLKQMKRDVIDFCLHASIQWVELVELHAPSYLEVSDWCTWSVSTCTDYRLHSWSCSWWADNIKKCAKSATYVGLH